MKFFGKIIMILIFLTINMGLNVQIKNQKIEKIKIFENCEMCKKTIEKTGSSTNISQVIWDQNTKIATITYDEKKISLNDILKKIAKSGYSSEKYKAKESDYNQLPLCCHY
jgi:copper chaperone CopZ